MKAAFVLCAVPLPLSRFHSRVKKINKVEVTAAAPCVHCLPKFFDEEQSALAPSGSDGPSALGGACLDEMTVGPLPRKPVRDLWEIAVILDYCCGWHGALLYFTATV